MINFSTMGYKEDSPDKNNPYNLIPGSRITMKNVNRVLTLVPIISGKPDYTKKRIARPGDPDIDFGPGVEGVLEVPYAQVGIYTHNGYKQGPFSNEYVDGLNRRFSHNPYFVPEGVDPLTGQSFNPVGQVTSNEYTTIHGYNYDKLPKITGKEVLEVIDGRNTSTNINTSLLDNYVSENAGKTPQVLNGNTVIVDNSTMSKEDSKDSTVKDSPFISGYNPYVGWDMATAANAFGAFVKYKPEGPLGTGAKVTGILGSLGKLGFEGARNFMQGYSAMNRFQQAEAEKARRMREARRNDVYHVMKSGGYLTKMATGHFVKGSDDHPNPNVEVEKGEYVKTPGGQTMEVLGKRHSEGGELLNLPEGTKVVSDYLKIGPELAKFFKKNYKLNVTSGSKFATVLDLYKRKIGLEEVLKEEERILNKMKDVENIENDGSKLLNIELLRDKYQEEVLPLKTELEEKFKAFTDIVFEGQEEVKQKEDRTMKYYKQQGGPVEGGQDQIGQLIQMYAQVTGQDVQQLVQQIQNMPEEQIQAALQQMMQVVQQAMSGGNSGQQDTGVQSVAEEQPVMRYGGLSSLKYLQRGGVYTPTVRRGVLFSSNGELTSKYQSGGYVSGKKMKAT